MDTVEPLTLVKARVSIPRTFDAPTIVPEQDVVVQLYAALATIPEFDEAVGETCTFCIVVNPAAAMLTDQAPDEFTVAVPTQTFGEETKPLEL